MGHNCATWRIRLNRPCAAAKRLFCQITLITYYVLLFQVSRPQTAVTIHTIRTKKRFTVVTLVNIVLAGTSIKNWTILLEQRILIRGKTLEFSLTVLLPLSAYLKLL